MSGRYMKGRVGRNATVAFAEKRTANSELPPVACHLVKEGTQTIETLPEFARLFLATNVNLK